MAEEQSLQQMEELLSTAKAQQQLRNDYRFLRGLASWVGDSLALHARALDEQKLFNQRLTERVAVLEQDVLCLRAQVSARKPTDLHSLD